MRRFWTPSLAFTLALAGYWGGLCVFHGIPWWADMIGSFVIGFYGWRIFR